MWGIVRQVGKWVAPWLVGGTAGYVYGVTSEDGQGFGNTSIGSTIKSGINLITLFAVGGIIYLILRRK